MAASPERPFAPDGKTRLGNDSLKRLLYAIPEGKLTNSWNPKWGLMNSDNDSVEFQYLEDQFRRNIDVKIPSSLSESLGFDKLKWQMKSISNLSILLLGYPPMLREKRSLNNAVATIDLEQRAIAGSEDAFGKTAYEPFHLRIAGIDKEQNKIVAVKYDLTENNRLIAANISISEIELDSGKPSMLNLLSKSMLPLERGNSNPYFTAGLITPRMLEEIKLNDSQKSDHKWAFSLEADSRRHFFPKRPDSAHHEYTIFSDLGYFLKEEYEILVAGLRLDAARKRGIPIWDIIIPTSLPKV